MYVGKKQEENISISRITDTLTINHKMYFIESKTIWCTYMSVSWTLQALNEGGFF